MRPSHPWNAAEDNVRLAIRRRSILALRDLYADFSLPPTLEEESLVALDEALTLYGHSRTLLGAARVREAAENIGCLAGEILVNRRGARWVVDGAEERLGLRGESEGPIAEPVLWALERAAGTGRSLGERFDAWFKEQAA
jgi:hypothetical protein